MIPQEWREWLECYRTGQMSDEQLEQHCLEDPDFAVWFHEQEKLRTGQ
jgi:hypothetical protein